MPDSGAITSSLPQVMPTGLRMFNLGTVPASVTPPRSWQRAAWFAGAITAVVVGALCSAPVLVGRPRTATTIDALPGPPSQHLMITDLPIDGPTTTTRPSPSPSTVSRTTTPPRPASNNIRPPDGQSTLPERVVNQVQPGTADVTSTTNAKPLDSIELIPLFATDQQVLGERTRQYFTNVVDSPQAAVDLTSGELRQEGAQGMRQRYAGIRHLEVQKVVIETDQWLTRSILVATYADGSTKTMTRELYFSHGADPRITNDQEVS